MLERATGCIENGGRRLLRLTSKHSRPRRSLHSAFWCHGAGDIDLPSWWISLLQQPLPETVSRSQGIVDTARKCLSAGFLEAGFLDFLYPAKTLTLIHKLAVRDANQLNIRSQRLSNQSNFRAFTSEAVEPRVAIESDLNHAMGLIYKIQEKSDTESKIKEKSGMESKTKEKSDIRLKTKEKSDIELKTKETFMTVASPVEKIIEKARPKMPAAITKLKREYDKAWQHYEKSQAAEDVPACELLPLLTQIAKLGSNLENRLSRGIVKLCADIPLDLRSKELYAYGIAAAIHTHDLKNAMKLYSEALRHGSCSQTASQELMRYVIRNENYQACAEIWAIWKSWKPCSTDRSLTISEYLLDSESLRMLMERVEAIGRAACKSIEGVEASRALCNFAIAVILLALKRPTTPGIAESTLSTLAVLGTLTKLNSDHFSLAMKQLLSANLIEYNRQAITLYERMRAVTDLVPPREMLEDLIVRLSSYHDYEHLKLVFDDYHTHYTLPSPAAFSIIMSEMSYQGDAVTFYDLLEEYKANFGNPTNPDFYRQLLHLHARRLELEQVVEKFDALRSTYHFEPTVDCWNVVIAAYARVSDIDSALLWYNKMCDQGVQPDANSMATMMSMYASGGDVDAIKNLMQECRERKLKASTSMIDSLVLANIKNDDHDEAERIVSDALKMDLVGSRTHMWNYILNAAALQRDLNKLHYLHQCMQEADIPPDEMTYAALMQGLCVHGMPKQAWMILKRVMPEKNLRPTAFHYAVVFGGLINSGEPHKIVEYYRDMLNSGIRPNFSTQSMLLKNATMIDAEGIKERIRTRKIKRAKYAQRRRVRRRELAIQEKQGTLEPKLMEKRLARRMKQAQRRFLTKPLDMVAPINQGDPPRKLVVQYERSEKVLAQILEKIDVMEVAAPGPTKGVGFQRLDEAYISNYFEYLIFLNAQNGSHDKVPKLFEQYLKAAKRIRPESEVSLPLKMLSALMVSYRKLNDHVEVERFWYLAMQKAEPIARRTGASLSEPNWVLPARRFILSTPLLHYMKSLIAQRRVSDIEDVFADLRNAGYALSNKVVNLYVQALVNDGKPRKAFQITEEFLMDGWTGWLHHGSRSQNSKLPTMRRTKAPHLQPGKLSPDYLTLVYLVKAVMNVRALFNVKVGYSVMRRLGVKSVKNPALEKLKTEAPRAWKAVMTLPRRDDKLQRTNLRPGNWKFSEPRPRTV